MDISWLAWECLDVPPEDWEEVAQENMISAVILKLLSTQTQINIRKRMDNFHSHLDYFLCPTNRLLYPLW